MLDHCAPYPVYKGRGICGEPATVEFDPMMDVSNLCPRCAADVCVEADLLGYIRDELIERLSGGMS